MANMGKRDKMLKRTQMQDLNDALDDLRSR